MVSSGLFTSVSDRWFTPPDLLAEIAAFYGGSFFDPCPATLDLPTVDGLSLTWRGRVFCNPPYGRVIGKWVGKGLNDPLDELILLVPARTDTAWFQPCFEHAICFICGRLHFSGHENGAPFPSALVYRGYRANDFRASFEHRGRVVMASAHHEWHRHSGTVEAV